MYKIKIGCSNVHETEDLVKATDVYEDYVNESKGKDPLYSSKPVLLLEDGEIILKYKPGKR